MPALPLRNLRNLRAEHASIERQRLAIERSQRASDLAESTAKVAAARAAQREAEGREAIVRNDIWASDARRAAAEADRDRATAGRDADAAIARARDEAHQAQVDRLAELAATAVRTLASVEEITRSAFAPYAAAMTAHQQALDALAHQAVSAATGAHAMATTLAAQHRAIADQANVIGELSVSVATLAKRVDEIKAVATSDRRIVMTRPDGTTVEAVVNVKQQ